MNAAKAMERIEGHAFSATVNLASDFRTFLRILAAQPEVGALAEAMKSERVAGDVLARILQLAAPPVDPGYEHPADSALAAYLWVLSSQNRDYSAIAVETVLGCEQCWWSRRMAEYVRGAPRSYSHAGFISQALSAGGPQVSYQAHDHSGIVAVAPLQHFGRMSRPQMVGVSPGVVVYPIVGDELPNLFRNKGTGNRVTEVLAGR